MNPSTHQTAPISKTTQAIQSMTGYALRDCDLTNGDEQTAGRSGIKLQIELRSVNSRFLDLSFKLPDALRYAEPMLRDAISKRVKRGKVECRANYSKGTEANQSISVNHVLLSDLLACAQVVSEQLSQSQGVQLAQVSPLSLGEILRWPGICQSSTSQPEGDGSASNLNTDAVSLALAELCELALTDFCASRQREGNQTANTILANAAQIEVLTRSLEHDLTAINKDIHERFAEKVSDKLQQALRQLHGVASGVASGVEIGANSERGDALKSDDMHSRIHQEIVLLALRADVAEELARLSAHIVELRASLSSGGPVGKKLDFLMQEFNREANTLGSKAQSPVVTKTAMSLKVLIEQIREQVQNLE